MVKHVVRVSLLSLIMQKDFTSGESLFLQTKPKSSQRRISCRRPDCRVRFVTMAGRAKHMGMSEMCKKWWDIFSKDAKERALWEPPVGPSSEVGSDDDCYRLSACSDTALEDLVFDAGMNSQEDTDSEAGNNAHFTSLPWGVDHNPADIFDEEGLAIKTEEFPGAARVFSEEKNLFTQLWESDGLYQMRKQGGPYYPFSGAMEWEVAEWLQTLDVPMERIDQFFKLAYVRTLCFI